MEAEAAMLMVKVITETSTTGGKALCQIAKTAPEVAAKIFALLKAMYDSASHLGKKQQEAVFANGACSPIMLEDNKNVFESFKRAAKKDNIPYYATHIAGKGYRIVVNDANLNLLKSACQFYGVEQALTMTPPQAEKTLAEKQENVIGNEITNSEKKTGLTAKSPNLTQSKNLDESNSSRTANEKWQEVGEQAGKAYRAAQTGETKSSENKTIESQASKGNSIWNAPSEKNSKNLSDSFMKKKRKTISEENPTVTELKAIQAEQNMRAAGKETIEHAIPKTQIKDKGLTK